MTDGVAELIRFSEIRVLLSLGESVQLRSRAGDDTPSMLALR